MTNTNAKDGRRSVLNSLSSFSAFRHRPRRSESASAVVNIPTAGFATTSTLPAPSPTVASPQHDAAPHSHLPNFSPPTRRPEHVPTAVPEAPPPYSPSRRCRDTADRPPMEDKHALLKNFDTVFVIDDSNSMNQHWREVNAILANIAPICTQYDEDGIDIYFINHGNGQMDQAGQAARSIPQPGKAPGGYNNVRDAKQVTEIFKTVRPSGNTLTGGRLRSILKPYMRLYEDKLSELRQVDKYGELDQKEMKPINVIVFTDDEPDDDLRDELIGVAKKLDKLEAPLNQVGIQFFLVGDNEGAAKYFQDLDDNLGKDVEGGLRDIVDTATWDKSDMVVSSRNIVSTTLGLSAEGVLKVVLGAVVRRLDRQETKTGRGRTDSRGTTGGSP